MPARTLLLTTLFISALTTTGQAEFNPQEAFEAHRDLMVGGTWVTTGDQGKVEADRHVASKSKKFVRIVNVIGGTAFAGIYGMDPSSGEFTLWVFEDDDAGSIGKWTCTAYEKGKWTWVSQHKDGPLAGTAVLTRTNKDEIKINFSGKTVMEQIWKREQ